MWWIVLKFKKDAKENHEKKSDHLGATMSLSYLRYEWSAVHWRHSICDLTCWLCFRPVTCADRGWFINKSNATVYGTTLSDFLRLNCCYANSSPLFSYKSVTSLFFLNLVKFSHFLKNDRFVSCLFFPFHLRFCFCIVYYHPQSAIIFYQFYLNFSLCGVMCESCSFSFLLVYQLSQTVDPISFHLSWMWSFWYVLTSP